jgi:hypothetical protein
VADVGRSVGAFQILNDRIYYISEDGKLYCYSENIVDQAKGCINKAVGPEGNVVVDSYNLTVDGNGNLYLTASPDLSISSTAILQYNPVD